MNPRGRIIFLYPTRATATEGFKDYVSWAPEADVTLIHGTARYELERMFENPIDSRYGKSFLNRERLFAIGYWPRRIFSATVDQFLGFMQNNYGSTCLLPLLADSILVVDEVHSFDESLFSALRAFINNFNVPLLCMTASLPKSRIDIFRELNFQVFPEENQAFLDLTLKASMKRYKINEIEGEDAAYEMAVSALKKGKKVLWVVNTVKRCQKLARKLNALCYHSRFRLQDRNERHKEVVNAFQSNQNAVVALTTQVCEMSLDLDADVLITEFAPITSMIQRMGRCNRNAQPGSGKIGRVYIYSPENKLPYNDEILDGTSNFVKMLNGKTASQTDLEKLLQKLEPGKYEVERYTAFLKDGPWASSSDYTLRDIKEFSVPAVLDSDVALYRNRRKSGKIVDGLILPAPRKHLTYARGPDRYIGVVDSSKYSSKYGLLDKAEME